VYQERPWLSRIRRHLLRHPGTPRRRELRAAPFGWRQHRLREAEGVSWMAPDQVVMVSGTV